MKRSMHINTIGIIVTLLFLSASMALADTTSKQQTKANHSDLNTTADNDKVTAKDQTRSRNGKNVSSSNRLLKRTKRSSNHYSINTPYDPNNPPPINNTIRPTSTNAR